MLAKKHRDNTGLENIDGLLSYLLVYTNPDEAIRMTHHLEA